MRLAFRLGRAAPFLLVALLGLYLLHVANQFDFVARSGRAGPDLWPKIVLGLMLLASVFGAVQALFTGGSVEDVNRLLRAASRAAGKEDEARRELDAEQAPAGKGQLWRALAAIAAMLAYVGGVPYVGFAIATTSLMFAVMLLAGYRRPLIAALIAILGALAFFIVFQRVAYISLPLGVGPFKAFSTALMALIGVR